MKWPWNCISWNALKEKFHSVSFPLHTTIFSKNTELLQFKNIFRIFSNYFWNVLEIKFFKTKIKVYAKMRLFFKNGGHGSQQTDRIVNSCRREFVTEPRTYKRKEKTKKNLQVRKRDSKEAYYLIIHDLSLTDKEDFRKYLQINTSAAIRTLLFLFK